MTWIKDQPGSIHTLNSLSLFFESYHIELGLLPKPQKFLARSLVLPEGRDLPDFYETTCSHSRSGIKTNNQIHEFLEFVLGQDAFTAVADDRERATSPAFWNPVPYIPYGKRAQGKAAKGTLRYDKSLGWLERRYPQLAEWREFALKWLDDQSGALQLKLSALSIFFERYLVGLGLPVKPAELLARGFVLPDGKDLPNLYKTASPESEAGARSNNYIHNFLEFVLRQDDFIALADDGEQVTSPAFRNPVPDVSSSAPPKTAESVYDPLPYIYMVALREMLAEGPNFRDWNGRRTRSVATSNGEGPEGPTGSP